MAGFVVAEKTIHSNTYQVTFLSLILYTKLLVYTNYNVVMGGYLNCKILHLDIYS